MALVLTRWSLPVDVNNLTVPLPNEQCNKASLPRTAVPALTTLIEKYVNALLDSCWTTLLSSVLFSHSVNPLPLPEEWFATAVLHPFSPPQSSTTKEDLDTPFFQLSLARVAYSKVKGLFAVKVNGCDDGQEWWYLMRGNATYKSKDGKSWKPANMGWSFPTRTWNQGATYVGKSE